MPSLEHASALSMDYRNALTHLFRTTQQSVLYVACDADIDPCYNMNSTQKHLAPNEVEVVMHRSQK